MQCSWRDYLVHVLRGAWRRLQVPVIVVLLSGQGGGVTQVCRVRPNVAYVVCLLDISDGRQASALDAVAHFWIAFSMLGIALMSYGWMMGDCASGADMPVIVRSGLIAP